MLALWDQPFKNYKNEWQYTKNEKQILKNAYSLIKYNQPKTEIPMSTYKMGGASVKLPLIYLIFAKPFDFGYAHIINSGLDKCIYYKQFW